MLCKIVVIEPCFMIWEGTAVISVLVLQNRMEVLRGEVHSFSDTCVTSAEFERVSAVTEENEQERTTTPVIKTEPRVSCVCGDCMHISYRL